MEIFLNILLLIFGLILLVKGADFFVDGSSNIARLLKIPSLIIGLTLVSMGTSAPELSVSITSALAKQNALSFGNVIGSNIFNILMVIGIAVVISPMMVSKDIQRKDLPILIFVYALLILFGFVISPLILEFYESIILVAVFILYIIYLIIRSFKEKKLDEEKENEEETKSPIKAILFLVFGLFILFIHLYTLNFHIPSSELFSFIFSYLSYFVFYGFILCKNYFKKEEKKDNKVKQLVFDLLFVAFGLLAIVLGGDIVVKSASFIAEQLKMDEVLIGLTIVAIGTSLPELVTTLVASKKQENDIALGNAIGSCIFNVLLIIGISSSINPLTFTWDNLVDVLVMSFTAIITLITTLKTRKINRLEGLIMVAVYIGYTTYIIARNYM